jgi:hypothetical protein
VRAESSRRIPTGVAWKAQQDGGPSPAPKAIKTPEEQITPVCTVEDCVENDVPMTEDTNTAVEFLQEHDFIQRYDGTLSP